VRKLLVFIILISYSIASFGIGLNYFYCCGKLKSVTVRVNVEDRDSGNKAPEKCCDHKKLILKLKLAQRGGNNVSYQFQPPIAPAIVHADSYVLSPLSTELRSGLIHLHSPPGSLISLNIFYCIFRI